MSKETFNHPAIVAALSGRARPIAKQIGVSPGALYHIIHGRRYPSIQMLVKIANATGTPVEHFFSGKAQKA